jgi:hypothetical protein
MDNFDKEQSFTYDVKRLLTIDGDKLMFKKGEKVKKKIKKSYIAIV